LPDGIWWCARLRIARTPSKGDVVKALEKQKREDLL
jgi:hypothetical protein